MRNDLDHARDGDSGDDDRSSREGLDRRTFLAGGLWAGGSLLALTASPGALRAARSFGNLDGDIEGGRVGSAAVMVAPPLIITRQEWGADEALRSGTQSFAPISKIIVHHTVTSNEMADPAAVVRAIYRNHTVSNGWNDIGYNALIDPAGRVYEGRWARDYPAGVSHSGEDPLGNGVVGAHASGFNAGTYGIALLGLFLDRVPTEAAIGSLVRLIASKFGSREIDPRGANGFVRSSGATVSFPNIAGHRDISATACPGGPFHAMIPNLRDRVAARLRAGLIGYRVVTSDGSVASFGDVGDAGDLPRLRINAVARAVACTPDGGGYWVLGTDGGIFSFGTAPYLGSVPGLRIRTTVMDLAPTPSGNGYWVLGTDGGIFSFGDAKFFGSVPGAGARTLGLRMTPTPSGNGYWVLGTDGGIFSFGDAKFFGSLPGLGIRTPVVDLAPTPSGNGYWVLGTDGGIFSFGDAKFFGSVPALRVRWASPARAILPTPTGEGYLVLASDGGIFAFGDAPFLGSAAGLRKTGVDLAPVIQR